jgi:hypothetical protein
MFFFGHATSSSLYECQTRGEGRGDENSCQTRESFDALCDLALPDDTLQLLDDGG